MKYFDYDVRRVKELLQRLCFVFLLDVVIVLDCHHLISFKWYKANDIMKKCRCKCIDKLFLSLSCLYFFYVFPQLHIVNYVTICVSL